MTPFWGADKQVADWVAAHIPGCGRGFEACRALGVSDRSGKMCAGVVFHDWSPEHGRIELSAAATNRRWLTRTVANVAMDYAFQAARMAYAQTSEHNKSVRRLWRALNGTEYVIPGFWGWGEAGVLITLTEDQWKKSRLCYG